MPDYTDPQGMKREIEQEAYRYYEQLSGNTLARNDDGSFRSQGHNDELDAFRHAYVSGRVTQVALDQQWIARRFGNDAEIGPSHRNDPYEHRMDLWNNEAGRRIGDDASGPDELARETYRALRDGTLVTGLDDLRLRQLHADDPRLRLPPGHPDRELVDADDVDAINRDAVRLQDQARDRFPAAHPDRAYFDALRGQLPEGVSDTKVAEVMLAAKQAGIRGPGDIAGVALRDDQVFVAGRTPGFRAQVDLDAPAPDMRQTVYATDQHNLVQGYEEQSRQQAAAHAPSH